MCPDAELLSVYVDGELPSPWKEKLEAHLVSCAECSAKIDSYQRIDSFFEKEKELMTKGKERPELLFPQRQNFWQRRVSIPNSAILAAGAAALALFALSFGLQFARLNTAGSQAAALVADTGANSTASAAVENYPVFSNMDEALKYFSNSGMDIIQLPVEQSFAPLGKPAIIRAADYHPANWSGKGQ
ncbi:MAG: zf-HC2 domain-containing protein [Spirochaetaceae bacterium]|jgi:anti-sigma factor RsiW|nr:zf-HC2 domain-containing protein [Spirochaetaceae bacterium]